VRILRFWYNTYHIRF